MIRGLIAETPSGWQLAMEHDTHHGPAMRELLRDATPFTDYEGRRAGHRRLRAVRRPSSDE